MAAIGTVMPAPKYTAYDNNGAPLVGGKLYVYEAGTSTPATTYLTVDLDPLQENTNPIILDAGGRATVFLAPGSYKFVQKTTADVTVWSQDNISSVAPFNVEVDVAGTAGETMTAGQVAYLETGSGGTAGRWYLADADDATKSSTAATVGMVVSDVASGSSGSFRIQGRTTVVGPLTPGASYYVSATAGDITSTAPSNVRFVGQADSTTSIVVSPNPSAVSYVNADNILANQVFS